MSPRLKESAGAVEARSYRDRTGDDLERGDAIEVSTHNGDVVLGLGVMRNFGSLSTTAWAALSPDEARELADDLYAAARRVVSIANRPAPPQSGPAEREVETMAENSAISWTDHTFNPWWGCTKVGPGCDHCYADAFDRRVGGAHWGPGVERRLIKNWSEPRKWQREAERTGVRPWVFCASMADVFDNEVPPEWRERLWALVRETPLLRWIFVTKRIGNAAKMLPPDWPEAFGHCGLVSTVVNQIEADRDIPKLQATPAAWRGLSMEPLLGDVQLRRLRVDRGVQLDALTGRFEAFTSMLGGFAAAQQAIAALPRLPARLPGLDWVIVGGESGPGARPMHPDWARSLRDQCASAGVPFHFKQWGEWIGVPDLRRLPGGSGPGFGTYDHCPYDMEHEAVRVGKARAGRLLDGVEHNGMPALAGPGATLHSIGARP